MGIETPNFNPENPELKLTEEGKEAIGDLKKVMELVDIQGVNIPEEQRQQIINELTNKINNQTDEDWIDLALLKAIKEVQKIRKEIRDKKRG